MDTGGRFASSVQAGELRLPAGRVPPRGLERQRAGHVPVQGEERADLVRALERVDDSIRGIMRPPGGFPFLEERHDVACVPAAGPPRTPR